MSPFRHVEEGPAGEVQLSVHATFSDRTSENGPVLTEHNYMRLSGSSSRDCSVVNPVLDEKDDSLNLKATELTLGFPGSQSPVRSLDLSLSSNAKYGEKSLLFLDPSEEGIPEAKQFRRNNFPSLQTVLSGNKRRFSDTMDGYPTAKANVFVEGKMVLSDTDYVTETAESFPDGSTFIGNSELELMSAGVKAGSDTWHAGGRDRSGAVILSPKPSQDLLAKNVSVKHYQRASPSMVKENVPLKICHDRPHVSKEFNVSSIGPAVDYEFSLVAKEQVVGWPPIRSYLKSTLAANSKSNDEVQGKPSSGPLFIKVSMDGAPYLRKMDLKTCATYDELSSSLEKMFSFTICRCGSNRAPSKDVLNDGKLMDILNGSEYAITYKDKDGDWMLLGDVPWEMFVSFCKRIRIMKGYDAIGLAPKAMLKSRSGS